VIFKEDRLGGRVRVTETVLTLRLRSNVARDLIAVSRYFHNGQK